MIGAGGRAVIQLRGAARLLARCRRQSAHRDRAVRADRRRGSL